MFLKSFINSVPGAVRGARLVAIQGLDVLRKDLAVTVYSVFVFLLVLLTIPLINTILLAAANGLANEPLFSSQHHLAKIIFVAISVFISTACAAMLLSYFACAVAASTLAQLDGHPAPLLKGLKLFRNRFRHISKFALSSIFYIPLGFIAQKRKLTGGTHINRAEVIGSSLSLSTAQLAPIILSEELGIYETIQHATQTLGKAWREGLVLKIGSYLLLLLLAVVSFLPKIFNHYSITGGTGKFASWLVPIVVFLGFLIVTKVLSAVLTATLYWRVVTNDGKKGKLLD